MMRTMRHTMKVGALVAVLLVASCSDNGGDSPILQLAQGQQMNWETQAAALEAAPNCDVALASFKQMMITGMLVQLEQQRQNYINYMEDGVYKGYAYPEAMEDGNSQESGGSLGTDSSDHAEEYSDTNVQVEGVDEADIVKTDGNLLVVVSGSDVVVVDAWPADAMQELGRVTLKTPATGIYRAENRIVALSYANRMDFEPEAVSTNGDGKVSPDGDVYYDDYYYRWEPMTLVTTIDITDPTAPVVVDEKLFDGTLLNSRRIDNRLYLVQQDYTYSWTLGLSYWPDVDYGATEAEVNEAFALLAQNNIDAINALTLEDLLPSYYALNAEGLIDESSRADMTSCTSLYYPMVYSGTGLITAVTVDITEAQAPQGSSVLGDWGTLYVSAEALYIAATNWSWWWWWVDDQEQPEIVTQVHKFGFRGDQGTAIYQASGTVPGYVLNQFSMDEYEGNLRVATTLPDWGWWDDTNDSENLVTVLAQDGSQLVQEGQLGGLGMGETIQSVRFVGDRGYVVTFLQTDPLFVLDLANPAAPTLTGELEIPGFSSYIHPLDATHLLTIGRDGDESGSTFGISFQIFDVSDPASPLQTAKTTLGEDDGWDSYLWSDAQWDHHAFVYFASRQMLAIPVSGWSWDEQSGSNYTNMLQLLHVDIEAGITPVGTISHEDLIGELPEVSPENSYCWYDLDWYISDWIQVKRGVFMDDFIFSISKGAIKVHDLTDLAAGEVNHVMLSDTSNVLEQLAQSYSYCWAY